MQPTRRPFLSLSLLLFTALLLSCSSNPVATAQTPEQKADALYGVYVIAKENGVTILNNPAVPDNVRRPVAVAMVASTAPMNALQDAVKAKQDLTLPLAQAQPVVDNLVSAVAGAKK